MNLHITPNRLTSDIQHEFNEAYPFLKLEFFTKKAIAHSDYSAGQRIQTVKKIGDIQLVITDGTIEIEGKMKVKDLEKKLKDDFGLGVQVFRKSGNLWLETTMTDNWSLDQQNNHGRELSTPIMYKPETGDYDLNRDTDH